MEDRISNLDALKDRLSRLLNHAEIQFNDDGNHATACWVEGPPEVVSARLKRNTDPRLWSESGGVVWIYKDPAQNILITLQWGIVEGHTLVMASVISLHVAYLAKCQQASAENVLQETSV